MARGTTLGTMLTMLRAECRYATDSGVAQSKNPALKASLKRQYAMLYEEHDWPHLLGSWEDKALSAGQRYYDFPTGIEMEGAVKAYHYWGGVWQPVRAGFDTEVYNEFDSDNDERADPVLAWRVYSGTQFEVWPMPLTAGTIRFVGRQAMGAFEADTDTCVLDDHRVVLFTAAEELGDKPRGKILAEAANRRLAQLKASQNKTVSFRPGESPPGPTRPRRSVVVVR